MRVRYTNVYTGYTTIYSSTKNLIRKVYSGYTVEKCMYTPYIGVYSGRAHAGVYSVYTVYTARAQGLRGGGGLKPPAPCQAGPPHQVQFQACPFSVLVLTNWPEVLGPLEVARVVGLDSPQ